MDGSDGSTDLRMSIPDSTAVFIRSTTKPDGSVLLQGGDLYVVPPLQYSAMLTGIGQFWSLCIGSLFSLLFSCLVIVSTLLQ
jgi:hypothetical protein